MADALVRRGLLHDDNSGGTPGPYCITPAGLKALADELESGRVKTGLARMKEDRRKQEREMKKRQRAKSLRGAANA